MYIDYMEHTIEPLFILKIWGKMLWVLTLYQSTKFGIRNLCCKLEFLCWIEKNVYLNELNEQGWIFFSHVMVCIVDHTIGMPKASHMMHPPTIYTTTISHTQSATTMLPPEFQSSQNYKAMHTKLQFKLKLTILVGIPQRHVTRVAQYFHV